LNSLVSLVGPFDRLRDRPKAPSSLIWFRDRSETASSLNGPFDRLRDLSSADKTKGSSTASAEEPSYLFASNTLTSKNNDAIRRSAITPLLSPFVKKK
jgi:hypothetical protein